MPPVNVKVIQAGDFIRASQEIADASAGERFDQARFFALCAENQGFNVQAFTSYEEAMEWLTRS